MPRAAGDLVLTDADRAAVAEAIAAAEAGTAGEIVVILAQEPRRYPATALTVATLAALALPLIVLVAGLSPAALLGGWDTATGNPERLTIEALLAGQALVFAAVLLLCLATRLDRTLTPHGLRRDRVHQAALTQFRARGFDRTTGRTGVLLYIDAAEHIAEVVADTGLFGSVQPDEWADTIAALTDGVKAGRPADGIVTAIARAGRLLAAAAPRLPDDVDELPNQLIEL